MKGTYIIILLTLLWAKSSSAQQIIRAKESYKHVGEMVTVKDSVYHGQVYNDSTLVIELGNRRLISPLSVVFYAGRNPKLADPNFVTSYMQRGPVSVTGQILMIKGHPTIVVTNWQALQYQQ